MSVPVAAPPCALPNSPLAKERKGIDACVHCGFCLQSCPTYLTLEDENDSPRGRILLMKSMLEGEISPSDESIETHIARCLGCRACETVCPSGVPYGQLLEATRATLAEQRPIPLVARLVLGVFEHPWLMRFSMAAGRLFRATGLAGPLSRLPGRAGFAMAMLHSTRRSGARDERRPASSKTRGSVALLTGCVMEGLFSRVNRATERVLLANDYAVIPAPGQQCCGALHAHAGDAEAARRLARVNIAAFERSGSDYVGVNAAGCGAIMREYPHLLADDREWHNRSVAFAAKVRDVSELLSAAGPARGGAVQRRVSYDAPCHLVHAQRISTPPMDVLRAVPGLELVPLTESDVCCGSAGIYNLVEPDTSNVVLDRKLAHIATANPDLIATGNPGCMMQIGAGLGRRGSKTRVVHPVELLDESYQKRAGDSPR